jgi:ribonucleoside-diphosphate reductase alpha chain
MIDTESIEAHVLNTKIFQHLDMESARASKWLAKEYGEPEWCEGLGIRNTTRLAIAPTKSTGAIMGGVSEGINPLISNVFTSSTSAGDINRINPVLLEIMKKRGVYNEETLASIQDNKGSVKHVDWLNEHEKNVFKTAFELNQFKLLKLASTRQRYIDQGQSLNLFIIKRDSDEYEYSTGNFISNLHLYATLDPFIKGLYYIYSDSPSRAESTVKILSQNKGECESCQ